MVVAFGPNLCPWQLFDHCWATLGQLLRAFGARKDRGNLIRSAFLGLSKDAAFTKHEQARRRAWPASLCKLWVAHAPL